MKVTVEIHDISTAVESERVFALFGSFGWHEAVFYESSKYGSLWIGATMSLSEARENPATHWCLLPMRMIEKINEPRAMLSAPRDGTPIIGVWPPYTACDPNNKVPFTLEVRWHEYAESPMKGEHREGDMNGGWFATKDNDPMYMPWGWYPAPVKTEEPK